MDARSKGLIHPCGLHNSRPGQVVTAAGCFRSSRAERSRRKAVGPLAMETDPMP
jgi:hypothetical protein